MNSSIRQLREEEFSEFVRVLELAAGRHPTAEALSDAGLAYPRERAIVLVTGDMIVGGTSSDVVELTLPGAVTTPAARATLTGVLPSHRGHGHASALLAAQLADMRRRGEAVAIATTSTPGLIWSVGYAPASRAVEVELTPSLVQPTPQIAAPSGRIRPLASAELPTVLPDVFYRHRVGQPGQVRRSEEFWRTWLLDRPLYRIGVGARFIVVHEDRDGRPQGYLTYRLSPGPLREQPVRELLVEDLVAVTEAAHRALWLYCATFTQAATVRTMNAPTDEPLAWMLSVPGGARLLNARDFLWVRLVDVAAALAARSYGTGDRLVLEVSDDALPVNAGRWRLDATGDVVRCVRTQEPPDLALDVRDVGAAYLGGTSLSTLARAGRVVERKPGALRRADAMLASDRAPWTVTDW